jgi:hypothetical protein
MHRFIQQNRSVRRRAIGKIESTDSKKRRMGVRLFISILLQSERGADEIRSEERVPSALGEAR